MSAGQVVIVTGGANGIGRATAEAFLAVGASVAVVDVADNVMESAAQLAAHDAAERVIGIKADMTDWDQILGMVGQVVDRFGRVDALINVAGGVPGHLRQKWSSGAAEDPNPKGMWTDVVEVNLTSAFLACQAVAPHMKRQGGGKIVNISSKAGRTGSHLGIGTGTTGYAAAKAGVIGLTKQLAREYGPHKINVNAIAPGLILSESFKRGWDARSQEFRDELLADVPLGYAGAPEEIASVALFLCSPGSSYIHGDTIDVNGGWYFS